MNNKKDEKFARKTAYFNLGISQEKDLADYLNESRNASGILKMALIYYLDHNNKNTLPVIDSDSAEVKESQDNQDVQRAKELQKAQEEIEFLRNQLTNKDIVINELLSKI